MKQVTDQHDWKSKDGFVSWTEGNSAFLSVVFSWGLPIAYQQAIFYKTQGLTVYAGGPAVTHNPDYLSDVALCEGGIPDAIARHNPSATFTSRGCVRNCKFCLVPKIEGKLRELDEWPIRPIVCDNNFLACSKAHFDRVVDRLKPLKGVDFNQGLDARLLTNYHASRLMELDLSYLRLAWDHIGYESLFMSAFETLLKAEFPPDLVRVYMLVGFRDTPADAVYRLQTIADLGALPCIMRYQPLDALQRNQFLGENWTEFELRRIKKYFSSLRFYGHIPFESFDLSQIRQKKISEKQMVLL